jgi:hypothetical protein
MDQRHTRISNISKLQLTLGNLALDFDVILEVSRFKVNIDHLSWSQTALLNNISFLQTWDHTSFAHHVNSSILRNRVASRAKTVAV